MRIRIGTFAATAVLVAMVGCAPPPSLRCNEDQRYLTCYITDSTPALMASDANEIIFASQSAAAALGAVENTQNIVVFDTQTRVREVLPVPSSSRLVDVSEDGAYLLVERGFFIEKWFLYDRAAASQTSITQSDFDDGNAWVPIMSNDGMTLAFSATSNVIPTDPDTAGTYDVYIYATADGSLRRITDGTTNGGYVGAISGDGTRVLTYQRGVGTTEIRVLDTATGSVISSYPNADYYFKNASLDFDGSTAVVGGYSDTIGAPTNVPQQYALVRLDVDSGIQQHLVRTDRALGKPELSDDGALYSYAFDEIYSVDTITGSVTQLSSDLASEGAHPSGLLHVDLDRNNPANAVGTVSQRSEDLGDWIQTHDQIFWTRG